MSVIPSVESVLSFLSRYDSYAIIGHEEPDGDCLCSQLALARFLTRRGKSAVCYTPGPFVRPEVMRFSGDFSSGPIEQAQAAVIVDCSTLERIGRDADEIADLPVAVIDHHSSGDRFGEASHIDPSAPSVTYMILDIIERSGDRLDAVDADILFFGLCTDTGFFRHLDTNSPPVFDAASRLVAAGASPKKTFAEMYGERSLASRQLLGRLLDRAEPRYDGRLLVTWETEADVEEFGKEARDSDTLYQQLLGVRECDVVVLVRAEDEQTCSVGLRSFRHVDVGKVAKHFGGGGHSKAAGFARKATVAELVEETVKYFADLV